VKHLERGALAEKIKCLASVVLNEKSKRTRMRKEICRASYKQKAKGIIFPAI